MSLFCCPVAYETFIPLYKLCWCKRSSYIFEESLSWGIRLFVWSKFNFFCGIAVSRAQTIAFSCYGYFICMPGVFLGTKTQRSMAFISLWKFLAYMLNVTRRFVMRIISYANIVHFIFI